MCIRQCEREGWSLLGNQCGGRLESSRASVVSWGGPGVVQKRGDNNRVVHDKSKALLGKNCLLLLV